MKKKVKTKLNDKDRIVIKNSTSALITKGISLFITFFSMPLYLKFFNNNSFYGVWLTILSLLTWINLFDLGLGNGLRNNLVEYIEKKDKNNIKKLISSTYIMISIIAIISCIVLVSICILVNWNSFFNINVSIISNSILKLGIIILVIGVFVSFILKIVSSILYSLQKSRINNYISLISSTILVLFLFFFNGKNLESNYIIICIVYSLSIIIPYIVASIFVFFKELKVLPSIKFFDKKLALNTIKLGMKFFAIQVLFMLIISTNEIIITKIYGPMFVVNYQIYYRLYILIGTLCSLTMAPVWSAVTKASVENDIKWIDKVNKIIKRILYLVICIQAVLTLVLQFVINIWLGENAIIVDYGIAIVFALFGIVYSYNILITVVANGIEELKTQLKYYFLGVLFKLPMILIFNAVKFSWVNVVISNIIILSIFCSQQNIEIKKILDMKMQIEK